MSLERCQLHIVRVEWCFQYRYHIVLTSDCQLRRTVQNWSYSCLTYLLLIQNLNLIRHLHRQRFAKKVSGYCPRKQIFALFYLLLLLSTIFETSRCDTISRRLDFLVKSYGQVCLLEFSWKSSTTSWGSFGLLCVIYAFFFNFEVVRQKYAFSIGNDEFLKNCKRRCIFFVEDFFLFLFNKESTFLKWIILLKVCNFLEHIAFLLFFLWVRMLLYFITRGISKLGKSLCTSHCVAWKIFIIKLTTGSIKIWTKFSHI